MFSEETGNMSWQNTALNSVLTSTVFVTELIKILSGSVFCWKYV